MKKQAIILIMGVIILACIIGVGAYILTQPQYKTINMTGITIEVPTSDSTVNNNSVNYNTYNDQENNLSVKTWAYRDINDANGTAQAVLEIGTQYGLNMAQNVTYDNVSVANKSGTYSYYETDETNKCIILITGTNIDQVTHAVKSINKTGINPVGGNITLENLTNQTGNITNNTTVSNDNNNGQSTTQTTSKTSKKTSSSSNKPDYTDTDDYKKGYIDKNGYTTGKGQFQEAGLSPREQQRILREIGDS